MSLQGSRIALAGAAELLAALSAAASAPAAPYVHAHPYAGRKTEFLAIVPWVTADAPRDQLRDTARKLAPGSGDPLENDYVETAIAADLPFPPDPRRPSCVRAVRR